jgi:hypothetical protein
MMCRPSRSGELLPPWSTLTQLCTEEPLWRQSCESVLSALMSFFSASSSEDTLASFRNTHAGDQVCPRSVAPPGHRIQLFVGRMG